MSYKTFIPEPHLFGGMEKKHGIVKVFKVKPQKTCTFFTFLLQPIIKYK